MRKLLKFPKMKKREQKPKMIEEKAKVKTKEKV